MITCKEDLINTYIENDFGELRDLYINKAAELGFDHQGGEYRDMHWYKLRFIGITDDNLSPNANRLGQTDVDNVRLSTGKKLTLSDLKPTKQYAVLHKGGSYSFQSDKPIGNDVVACFDLANSEKPLGEDFFDEKPRTKVEFVKVEDSIWHLESSFRLGELFAFDGNRDYVQIETEGDFTLSHSSDNLYRRIETEIDERQEFIDAMSRYAKPSVLGKMFDAGCRFVN